MNQNDLMILRRDTLKVLAQLEAAYGVLDTRLRQVEERKEPLTMDILVLLLPVQMTTMKAFSQLLQIELLKLAQYEQGSIIKPGG